MNTTSDVKSHLRAMFCVGVLLAVGLAESEWPRCRANDDPPEDGDDAGLVTDFTEAVIVPDMECKKHPQSKDDVCLGSAACEGDTICVRYVYGVPGCKSCKQKSGSTCKEYKQEFMFVTIRDAQTGTCKISTAYAAQGQCWCSDVIGPVTRDTVICTCP
jgi:hypothetical protein